MRQVLVFSKKEWTENLRTNRLLILFSVFLVLGLMSPLIAKLTPKLMEMLLPEMGDTLSSELSKSLLDNLPEPTHLDSWLQFFKNMSQMGLILIIIVYSGILTDERQRNTLPMLMTKGLLPSAIIVGKLLTNSVILSTTYLTGFLICLLYTWIYFSAGLTWSVLAGSLCLLLIYLFILSLFIFFGTLFAKTSAVLLSTVSTLGFLYLINLHHALPRYNPVSLIGVGPPLVLGSAQVSNYYEAIVVTVLATLALVVVATRVFSRQEI